MLAQSRQVRQDSFLSSLRASCLSARIGLYLAQSRQVRQDSFLSSLRASCLSARLLIQPIHQSRDSILEIRLTKVDEQPKSLIGQFQIGDHLFLMDRNCMLH
jgi:hypothetical protein